MFNLKQFSCCVVLLVVLVSPAAVQAIDYFMAELPVKSQSRSAQSAAAQQGLIDVLVRVSGTEEVRERPEVVSKARTALAFVEQFQFADLEDESLREQGYSHMVELQFSSRLVRKLLSEAQLPIWSVNRPKTLVWLVEDSLEYGKRMLSYDEENPTVVGLQQAFTYRGLPTIYPLLDFEDQLALGAEKLWMLDETAILAASERYGADAVLVGKYSQTSFGQVLSTWQFYHRDRGRSYDLRADTAEEVGYNAVMPLADYLASLYSYHADDSEYFSMSVTAINSFSDYRSLMNELSSFDTVSEVKVDHVDGSLVLLRIKSEANLEQLMSQITLGRSLSEVVGDATQQALPAWERAELGSPQNPLAYKWLR